MPNGQMMEIEADNQEFDEKKLIREIEKRKSSAGSDNENIEKKRMDENLILKEILKELPIRWRILKLKKKMEKELNLLYIR
jgi:hypothetical protein